MQKQWRMIACLAAMASLYWLGGRDAAQAQAEPWKSDINADIPYVGRDAAQAQVEAPQYPQYVQYPQGAPPVTPGVPAAAVTLSADQLAQLLGPIALYPDPLLSLILPAATYPQDVAAAEQWLQSTPNPTEADIAAQSWDASIKGLVHYPSVLAMMSGQMNWTGALGAAFLNQQQDVLACIQQLRAQAQAAQNLQTNPQEQVVADNGAIRIEPVDPEVIYVPQYDPDAVYAGACPVTYGEGYPIGLWCDDDFDWGGRCIVTGAGWYTGWHHPEEWDRHPPAWNRRPAGWAPAPRPWARQPLRPAPRLTSGVAARAGLNRARGATARPAAGAARAPQIGNQRSPAATKNVFAATHTRSTVQRAVQRAGSTTKRAATTPAPRRSAPAPRPAARAPAPRAAPARAAPRPAPQPARSSAFSGGSGGAARAQSARGNASASHR
ncbi:MAG: DUF3300 domain-containing protein [Candidatus Brocadiia bacterium]